VGGSREIRSADFSFQFQADEPKGGKTLEDMERAHIERILRETQQQPLAGGADSGYRPVPRCTTNCGVTECGEADHLIPLALSNATWGSTNSNVWQRRWHALSRPLAEPAGDARHSFASMSAGSSTTPGDHSSGVNECRSGCACVGRVGVRPVRSVLTFVFGEAAARRPIARWSRRRASIQFYGMPPRSDLLRQRLLKEASHELGHTFGLRHWLGLALRDDVEPWVERLDVKRRRFAWLAEAGAGERRRFF